MTRYLNLIEHTSWKQWSNTILVIVLNILALNQTVVRIRVIFDHLKFVR